MKTYEQTARDALQRIDAIQTKRRHRRRNAARATVAVSCVALTVLCSAHISSPASKTPAVTPQDSHLAQIHTSVTLTPETDHRVVTSVLQMAYLSDGGWDRYAMERQTEMPMRYLLSVIDVRGLTAAQRDALREEKVEQLHQALSEYYEDYNEGGGNVYNAWDNALFVLLRGGSFHLDVNEQKTVESLSAECSSPYGEVEFGVHSGSLVGQKVSYEATDCDGTKRHVEEDTRNGNAYLHAMGIALDGDTYHRICGDGELNICWRPSSKMYEALNADPTAALSDFAHQMTVTVRYTDGTCESHVLDIVFHDDGSIGAIYQGVNNLS